MTSQEAHSGRQSLVLFGISLTNRSDSSNVLTQEAYLNMSAWFIFKLLKKHEMKWQTTLRYSWVLFPDVDPFTFGGEYISHWIHSKLTASPYDNTLQKFD